VPYRREVRWYLLQGTIVGRPKSFVEEARVGGNVMQPNEDTHTINNEGRDERF